MKSIQLFIATLFVFFAISNSSAQKILLDSLDISDTIKVKSIKTHSPTKATLFSTAIPGLGQAYNKKYWKMPIIYAGIGTSMYFALSNHKSFKKFKNAYSIRIDGDPNAIDEYEGILTADGLLSNIDYHQRNRDLSYIVAGLFYVLQIVDAAVDAHLFNFPKNDNLSFNLQPSLELTSNNQLSKGFRLVINL
ncbi:MAG: hypothetical protein JKX68_12530 [Flavobacteriales bacterium]|nr:hypothetical protein [Flavobacteriales bacterium]